MKEVLYQVVRFDYSEPRRTVKDSGISLPTVNGTRNKIFGRVKRNWYRPGLENRYRLLGVQVRVLSLPLNMGLEALR